MAEDELYWKQRTFEHLEARIKESALKELENHELVQEGEGRFFLARRYRDGSKWHGKTDSAYHYRVIFAPGYVVLLGDLGSLVLSCYDRDSLSWLRGCIAGHDYVLSKIEAGRDARAGREKLYEGDVFFALKHEIEEHWADGEACPGDGSYEADDGGPHEPNPDDSFSEEGRGCRKCGKTVAPCDAEKVMAEWIDSHDDDDRAYYDIWYRLTGDCEYPVSERWDARTLWQYWALAWFCQLYDPRVAERTAGA